MWDRPLETSYDRSITTPPAEVLLALQDWQKLVENYGGVIPTMQHIEGMERLSREIAPLLAGTQQKQICTLGMQHHSRLQSQKQLNITLQQALASAGAACMLLKN